MQRSVEFATLANEIPYISLDDFRRLSADVVLPDDPASVYKKKSRVNAETSIILVHFFIEMGDREPEILFPDVCLTVRVRDVQLQKAGVAPPAKQPKPRASEFDIA